MHTIEQSRQYWTVIAKKNGWYKEPFFVQVWLDSQGSVIDSISYEGLDRDIIIRDEPECPRCGRELIGSSRQDIGYCSGCSGH